MGASEFEISRLGKTAREAFESASEDARWEYGHGGYTGTIAEKPGFIIIPRPPRVSAKKVAETVGLASLHTTDVFWGNNPEGKREAKKAYDRVVAWYGEYQARSFLRAYNDKWGNALAVEADPTLLESLRAREHKTGVRGLKGFIFFGMASC